MCIYTARMSEISRETMHGNPACLLIYLHT
ncbi:protein of unknown function (plasmid) [Caballeronia sp. S22]